MTNISDLFELVESHEMAARVNLASSVESALRILLREDAVVELLTISRHTDDALYTVLMRVMDLTRRSSDVRFENPYDAALLAYTVVIGECSEDLSLIAASAICHVPNLWWAASIARKNIENSTVPNDTATDTRDREEVNDVNDRIFVADTRDTVSRGARLADFVIWNEVEDAGSDEATTGGGWVGGAQGTKDSELAPA